ncbi:MAG: OmpH family outer membrane protein [Vicinamibacteraceae bacterium]
MKSLLTTVALSATLIATPLFAEVRPQETDRKPAAEKPAADAQQEPVEAPSVQMPERPSQPPRPFPEGSRVAYVDVQAIVSESAEGKSASTQIQSFADKKNEELQPKTKSLQEGEQKLEQTSSVMSAEARAELQRSVEQQRVELQRAQQDAQRELQQLNAEIQQKFVQKLLPVIGKVAQEKGLHFVLSLTPDVLFADSGLNITADVIKALDAAEGTSSRQRK